MLSPAKLKELKTFSSTKLSKDKLISKLKGVRIYQN